MSPQSAQNRFYDFVSAPFQAAFIAGGVAGAVSRTVVSPLERLKILYQVQGVGRNEYKMSIYKALKKMYVEEGFKGFMRGNGTNCIRIIPYSAVQFGSYSVYKKFAEETPGQDLSPLRRLICGGCAGITSVTCTYPLDIIRTRLSIQSASFAGLEKRAGKQPGMYETGVMMYKTEGGVFGLYRGIIPTIAGVAPYVGLNFMTYEAVRQYFTDPGEKNPVWVSQTGSRRNLRSVCSNLYISLRCPSTQISSQHDARHGQQIYVDSQRTPDHCCPRGVLLRSTRASDRTC